MEVVLNLYPQAITENVITKLRLLTASGVSLSFWKATPRSACPSACSAR